MYTKIKYGYDEERRKYRLTLYGWSFSLYKRTLSSTSVGRRNCMEGIKVDLIPPIPPIPSISEYIENEIWIYDVQ